MCPLVSAVLARGVCAEIPLFFVGQFDLQSTFTTIATLLFFRESAPIGFLTIRDPHSGMPEELASYLKS